MKPNLKETIFILAGNKTISFVSVRLPGARYGSKLQSFKGLRINVFS
jgi:hypothetical protein